MASRIGQALARTSLAQADVGLLLLRIWFGGVLAVSHGWGKVTNLANFTAGVEKLQLPMSSLLAAGAAFSELLGGLLLAVGLLTRAAAVPVAATMLVAAFVVHGGDPFSKKEFALAYAAAAVVLLIAGPGRISLDYALFKPKP